MPAPKRSNLRPTTATWTVALARELVVSVAVRALLWCAEFALR